MNAPIHLMDGWQYRKLGYSCAIDLNQINYLVLPTDLQLIIDHLKENGYEVDYHWDVENFLSNAAIELPKGYSYDGYVSTVCGTFIQFGSVNKPRHGILAKIKKNLTWLLRVAYKEQILKALETFLYDYEEFSNESGINEQQAQIIREHVGDDFRLKGIRQKLSFKE